MGLFSRRPMPTDFGGMSFETRREHPEWSAALEDLDVSEPLCVVNADGGRIEGRSNRTIGVGMFAVARKENGHPVLRYAFVDGRRGVQYEQIPSQRVFALETTAVDSRQAVHVVAHVTTLPVRWTVPVDSQAVQTALESIKPEMHNLGNGLP